MATLVLVALLVVSVVVAVWVWQELQGVEIGRHGWIALALGASGTLLVGGGLIFLVIFSNRRGYDDRIKRPDDFPRR